MSNSNMKVEQNKDKLIFWALVVSILIAIGICIFAFYAPSDSNGDDKINTDTSITEQNTTSTNLPNDSSIDDGHSNSPQPNEGNDSTEE